MNHSIMVVTRDSSTAPLTHEGGRFKELLRKNYNRKTLFFFEENKKIYNLVIFRDHFKRRVS